MQERRCRERELLPLARVEVTTAAWPDVTIRIGERTLHLTQVVRGMRFRFDPETDELVAEGIRT